MNNLTKNTNSNINITSTDAKSNAMEENKDQRPIINMKATQRDPLDTQPSRNIPVLSSNFIAHSNDVPIRNESFY